MLSLIHQFNILLDRTIRPRSRALLVVGALLLIPVYALPLWHITLYSNQYPEGLRLFIYPHKLQGGRGGNDLREINTLNHYIGMRDIRPQDFTELKWIPFALGAFILLALRAAVMGKVSQVVDLIVMFGYFGLFSLVSFYYRLYLYGHDLNPRAAVKVAPFTPPLIGTHQLANFRVHSYPDWGTLFMILFLAALVAALGMSVLPDLSERGTA